MHWIIYSKKNCFQYLVSSNWILFSARLHTYLHLLGQTYTQAHTDRLKRARFGRHSRLAPLYFTDFIAWGPLAQSRSEQSLTNETVSPSQKFWMWNWILPAKCRVMSNGSGKKELIIHPAVDFRIIWGARTKKLLPQVDHKSPIFDRMHVKKETVECVDLETWAFLFHSQVWTEREIRRETQHIFYGNRKKLPLHHDFRTAGAAGCPQTSRAPDHVHILQNGFFSPPPSSSTSRYSLATAVFPIFRTCYAWALRARRSFTDHSELLDKDMLASSAGYLILHS